MPSIKDKYTWDQLLEKRSQSRWNMTYALKDGQNMHKSRREIFWAWITWRDATCVSNSKGSLIREDYNRKQEEDKMISDLGVGGDLSTEAEVT